MYLEQNHKTVEVQHLICIYCTVSQHIFTQLVCSSHKYNLGYIDHQGVCTDAGHNYFFM